MKFGNLKLFKRTKCAHPLKYCVFHVTLLIAHVYETFVTCITLGRYTAHVRANIIFSDWANDID